MARLRRACRVRRREEAHAAADPSLGYAEPHSGTAAVVLARGTAAASLPRAGVRVGAGVGADRYPGRVSGGRSLRKKQLSALPASDLCGPCRAEGSSIALPGSRKKEPPPAFIRWKRLPRSGGRNGLLHRSIPPRRTHEDPNSRSSCRRFSPSAQVRPRVGAGRHRTKDNLDLPSTPGDTGR